MSALDASQGLLALAAHPRSGVLIALLVAAAVIDWRTLRIPNWLTLSGVVYGLAYNAIVPPPLRGGIAWALTGMAVGLVVLLPLYALRVMGAGDVKLMAMIGAFVGVPDIFQAILFTFIVGGIAAIGSALYHKAFRRMTTNVLDVVQYMAFAAMAGGRPTPGLAGGASAGKLPYGVSIAAGTIAWLVARLLGLA